MKFNLKYVLFAVVAAAIAGSALLRFFGEEPDVKIGFLGGFTGPIESLMPPISEGAKLAISQVNAQGGTSQGKIVYVTADTSCSDSTKAANAADRLVNTEKVIAIVGAQCSGATIASANNAAIPAGVTMISPASTSPKLTTMDDKDLVFRTAPSDAYQGGSMARLLKAKGYKKIVITYVNNDYGKGFAAAVKAEFEKNGGKVPASEAHEDGKADYRAEIGSLASHGSDILVVLAYLGGSGSAIIRQSLEGGDFSKFAGGDGIVGDKLIENIGVGKLDGLVATRVGSPELPGSKIFAEAAKAAKLDPKGAFVAQAYDAAFMLALAIEKNGSSKRAGVNIALRAISSAPGEVILPGEWAKAKKLIAEGKDINYEGATGSHEFDKNGDVPGVIVEATVKGKTFVDIGPAK